MREKGLQLVVPRPLHETYSPIQRAWLWDVADFFDLVTQREKSFCVAL